MQIGMIGVGRMGANTVQRLLADGHQCVVYDQDKTAQAEIVSAGAAPADSLESLIVSLESPRVIWIMVPAAAVDNVMARLGEILAAGHFVKMVHNGIEYGLMAAYAEGFAVLDRAAKPDTAPMLDVGSGEVAEVWRHGRQGQRITC